MSKGTTRRAVRVDDDLWTAAQTVAAEHGDNLSEIIRAALVAYVEQWGTK
jgi:antitoxin component of RelBE/YafQ-DinJ toxin-antitoxin module